MHEPGIILSVTQRMRFTVLTPTYNRVHLLGRVYESLCAQTFRDFEWVIVDDGGSDGTKELVASWKPFFPIRYTWKPNGGMHTALNVGIREAAGEFIVINDDDDLFVPHALERFDLRWKQIPNPERFAYLSCLCFRDDGATILGSRFPQDYVDAFSVAEKIALCRTDRWGIVRADIARQFLYPEFKNERFIDLGVVQNRIMKKYAARFFDEPLQIHHYFPDGLSHRGDLRWRNPKGAVVFHTELALSNVPLRKRVKSALNAARFLLVAVARELHLLK
jgi:glycosyltransferase involved in cell wall biosynthesis